MYKRQTIYSWFVYIRKNLPMEDRNLKSVIGHFEFCRGYVKGKYKKVGNDYIDTFLIMQKKTSFFELMLNTFNQRASMGSTDSLSIIYRDIIINLFEAMLLEKDSDLLNFSVTTFNEVENFNDTLEKIMQKYNWGEKF